MYIRMVTFGLGGVSPEQYAEQAAAVADQFLTWPGLSAKWWLADQQAGRYGGVYLFADKESADVSRTTPLFAALTGNPALVGRRGPNTATGDGLRAQGALIVRLKGEFTRGNARRCGSVC